MKSTILSIQDTNYVVSLQNFLGKLLETKLIDAILVPRMLPDENGFVQSLVTDAEMLAQTDIFAPTLAVQSAQILADLTSSPATGRIGVVLKPCELRAVIELAKFLQVNLDNVITIGVDCVGTYEVKDYADLVEKSNQNQVRINLAGVKDGDVQNEQENGYRESCRICQTPAPANADITIGFFGFTPDKEIALLVGERFEQEIQEKLGLELGNGDLADREKAIKKMLQKRQAQRDEVFAELRADTDGLDKLMKILSTCIRCHNCMNVCPICYCKECVFESAVFEHRSDQYLGWAHRKGAIRMPTDTLIFHLTRMSHMATSCVSCGMCDSACPNQIPVSKLFGLMGSELQSMFEYIPGQDTAEEPPVSVFKEDELQPETGTH